MAEAAKVAEGLGYAYVDVNMGCIIHKITRQGAGIALMGDEDRAVEIAAAMVDAVDIPVTCKMRLGLTSDAHNAVSLSKRLEDVGVSAVTIHGRTGEKKFGMEVDFEGIRRVVEAVNIPVVANGGIYTGAAAMEMMKKTGAAAVMPLGSPIGSGRGILNPANIRLILEQAKVPVIVDAGVGAPSDVAVAMELGVEGVLLNTGIALAKNPVAMARAMRLACEAGRLGYLAGRMEKKAYASASSPLKDF